MNLQFLTKDPKTTITALVGGIATLLGVFHVIDLPAEAQGAIITITIILIGLFAKDGTSGFSAAEKEDVITRLKHDGPTQFDPGSPPPQSGAVSKPGTVSSILLLVSALILFPMIQACGTIGTAGQPNMQQQWNSLSPDQQARVIIGGLQKELGRQFDQGKAIVTLKPEYAPVWKSEIVPLFDKANKTLRTLELTGSAIQLTPEAVYTKMQPIISELAIKLISIGMQKGGFINGSRTVSSYGGGRIDPNGHKRHGRDRFPDLAAGQAGLRRSDSPVGNDSTG